MNNNFVKIALVVLGFALTFFLSCADNPAPEYPDIGYFLSSSSRPSLPGPTSSSSNGFALSSPSVPSSSSTAPIQKPSSQSSTPR